MSGNTAGIQTPGLHEIVAHFANAFSMVFQAGADVQRSFSNAKPKSPDDPYDAGTQSWAGAEGLRYRVPMIDLPGEQHARVKNRNVRILMDNVRELCCNDMLPATKEEKQFWAQYRLLKYQLFFAPFISSGTVLYMAAKMSFHRLPVIMRGRTTPILLAGVFAEQYMEVNYPAQELLEQALTARTPLGDAARAEWQRLRPYTISFTLFTGYNYRLAMSDPIPGFAFGGDVASALT